MAAKRPAKEPKMGTVVGLTVVLVLVVIPGKKMVMAAEPSPTSPRPQSTCSRRERARRRG